MTNNYICKDCKNDIFKLNSNYFQCLKCNIVLHKDVVEVENE